MAQKSEPLKYSERTDKILSRDPVEVRRYAGYTRINHWVTAVSLILLLLSGMALFTPSLFFLTNLFGGGQNTRMLHPMIGVVLVISFMILFLQLWKFNIPRREDIQWGANIKAVMQGDEEKLPPLGKYNLGQKFVFWAMFGLIIVLIVTGVMMWEQFFGGLVSIPVRRIAILIHAVSAVLITLVFILHVYAAIWTRGTLSAMTSGKVTGGWAFKHHQKWFKELARRQRSDPTE
ncbi:MAG: formate dehydrogenase subunit gamma [Paracoccus denitrificans]|nr:MAG: formate dehydrogenase subunit gamma [Paracoccus denitrificans]PZO85636.1 MAG: formate dehydrogenase subunit gamma [Paracoccus denitrificans]